MTWRTIIITLLLFLAIAGISNMVLTGNVTTNVPALSPTWGPPPPVVLPVFSTCDANCSDATCVTDNAVSDDLVICLNSDIYENVTISANNVTLDCKGYTIDGTGTAYGANGVTVISYNDTKIRNCTITSFTGMGIELSDVDNATVQDINVLSTGDGIHLGNTYNTTVKNSYVYDTGHGIWISTAHNNTVRDNTVDSNNYGIWLYGGSEDNNLINNTVTSSAGEGFRIDNSQNNNLTNNTAQYNLQGIIIFPGPNNTLTGNEFSSNVIGAYIINTNDLTLIDNTITSNTNHGLLLSSSSNNTFLNNTVSSNTNTDFNSMSNSINNTVTNLTTGSTICTFVSKDIKLHATSDPGSIPSGYLSLDKFVYITNNSADSWALLNVSYTEAELLSYNVVKSTIKMWEYNVSGWTSLPALNNVRLNYVSSGNRNSFSVYAPLGRPPQNISNCMNLTTAGDLYVLNDSLYGVQPGWDRCIDIQADNITLDCDGYDLSWDGTGYGISSGDIAITMNNLTIKNCIVTNYNQGIHLFTVLNSTVDNNTVSYCTDGIYAEAMSESNTFSNNVLENNTGKGIWLQNSDYNIISSNRMFNNSVGINTNGYDSGTISDNNISDSTSYGLHILGNYNNVTGNRIENGMEGGVLLNTGSTYNTLFNNFIRNNTNFGIKLYAAYNTNVTGNTIIENTGDGIGAAFGMYSSSDCEFNNNTVYGNTEAGISFASSMNFSDNNVNNNKYGFYLRGLNSNLTNNVATNNTVWDYYSWGGSENNTVINMTTNTTLYSFYSKDVAIIGATNPGGLPDDYREIGKFLNITKTSGDSWIMINILYTENELISAGINESTLAIWKFNGSDWIMLDSELDAQYRNVTPRDPMREFSIITILGLAPVTPPPEVPGGRATSDTGTRITMVPTTTAPPAPGETYSSFTVGCENFGVLPEKVTLKLKVAKAWMTEKGIQLSNLRFYVYAGGWTPLEVTSTGEDTSYYYFNADAACAAQIAITFQKADFWTVLTAIDGYYTRTISFLDVISEIARYMAMAAIQNTR